MCNGVGGAGGGAAADRSQVQALIANQAGAGQAAVAGGGTGAVAADRSNGGTDATSQILQQFVALLQQNNVQIS